MYVRLCSPHYHDKKAKRTRTPTTTTKRVMRKKYEKRLKPHCDGVGLWGNSKSNEIEINDDDKKGFFATQTHQLKLDYCLNLYFFSVSIIRILC